MTEVRFTATRGSGPYTCGYSSGELWDAAARPLPQTGTRDELIACAVDWMYYCICLRDALHPELRYGSDPELTVYEQHGSRRRLLVRYHGFRVTHEGNGEV